jgi:spermidine/putrescine transport system substrate-binding protein
MDPRRRFLAHLWRYRKGSVSRRHFLGATGLGAAVATLAAAMPELFVSPRAYGAQLGSQVTLATWPNYHDPKNFDSFTAATGVRVEAIVFGSNEEMRAKLRAGGTGWDVLVPSDYAIETYVADDLIEPLDLSLIGAYQPQFFTDARFTKPGMVNGRTYGVHKNWGTIGYCVNTAKVPGTPAGWKDFWDLARAGCSGRVTVDDDPLVVIGNALKYFGYSFNSTDEKELRHAEGLLLDVKPHVLGITPETQPALRNGGAWLAMAWAGDAAQLHRDIPAIRYVLARDGGEIWSDYYAIPKGAPHRAAAYALIDFLLTPENNRNEVLAHGYPVADKRVLDLLPTAMLADPIMFPAAELLRPLEFAAAAALTNPLRAEIMARFKAS